MEEITTEIEEIQKKSTQIQILLKRNVFNKSEKSAWNSFSRQIPVTKIISWKNIYIAP